MCATLLSDWHIYVLEALPLICSPRMAKGKILFFCCHILTILYNASKATIGHVRSTSIPTANLGR